MKLKTGSFSSQLMIIAMAAVIFLLMMQVARAQQQQSQASAQNTQNQSQQHSNQSLQRGNVINMRMPQKSLGRRLLENTTLGYYQQFLGPTVGGPMNETYNVFQEGVDQPRTGNAPIQSFHAVNLRHQINSDWAIGTSLAAVNGYTEETTTRTGGTNSPTTEFFNARAYVSLPAYATRYGSLFTTVMYEAPTSNISKEDDMTWGWILANSFAFKLPSLKWSAGVIGQVYRINYENNVKRVPGNDPVELQTLIVSGGPYLNYRYNDRWMFGSLVTLDWDQRGLKNGSREFNNNLPHRGRLTATYFPPIKYVSSVGVFTQALLKFRPDTTAVGAELAVKF